MAKKTKFPSPRSDENKKINRGILKDADNPEWTNADFKRARPAAEVLPPEFLAGMEHLRRSRGRPRLEKPKTTKTFRLSHDVIEGIEGSGAGYNARVEAVLREALEQGKI